MKKEFLKENYSACWKFLKEIEWYIVFALGIFTLTFLVGFTFPIFFKEEIIKFITEMIASLDGKSTIELITFIFLNNAQASLMAILLGIGLGIFPLITTVINGYLLGFVARKIVSQEGLLVLWQLLPHGIFELPAVFFSIGIGIKIGTDLFKKDTKEKLKHDFKEGIRFFVFVIFPMLLIAGIIEGVLIKVLG
ncbi:MAG: stage II sporulation protein M [Nanoarchaeota archaeon]|nr:stage II sporulation protein M [Nanoarchaeota archaeon]